MVLTLVALLSACGQMGVSEMASLDWSLTSSQTTDLQMVLGGPGCPPLGERVHVTWNGTRLAPTRAGAQWIHHPAGCGMSGCRAAFDECAGYAWSAASPPVSSGLPEVDVIEVTDGERTLRATSPRPTGTFSWSTPPDGVVEASAPVVEFTIAVTQPPEHRYLPMLWAACDGPWWLDGEFFALENSINPAVGRYRLSLATSFRPPPSPGTFHCRVYESSSVDIADCPAKGCRLQRWEPLRLEAGSGEQVTFDITVR